MLQKNCDILRGKLIVSCQPVCGGPMDRPEVIAALALAAIEGGAAGLRIEGVANIKHVRPLTSAPIIGLVKHNVAGTPLRITPYLEDIAALSQAGADVIACDATNLPRPVAVQQLISAILAQGRIAMADCATIEDARLALGYGAQFLGSTMSGYTGDAIPSTPDLTLVEKLSQLNAFIVAEGRYQNAAQAAAAIQAGADAVVVGTALTRTEIVTGWFAQAIQAAVAK